MKAQRARKKSGSSIADVHTDDEVEELMHSIEELDRSLKCSLKYYIKENTEITAEREADGGERGA